MLDAQTVGKTEFSISVIVLLFSYKMQALFPEWFTHFFLF